jgi:arylsulfatase
MAATLSIVLTHFHAGGWFMSSESIRHRSHLPMPNTQRPTFIAYDAKDPDSKFPPIDQLRPPPGAPNVLIVLIDDAGFGSSSAFGGPC